MARAALGPGDAGCLRLLGDLSWRADLFGKRHLQQQSMHLQRRVCATGLLW